MITSRHNAKLKDIRRLRRCKDDRALLEGPRLIDEALASGCTIEEIFITPEMLTAGSWQPPADRAPTLVDGRLLDELADTDSPRGLLAVARLPRATVPKVPDGLYLYVDGLQDPGNLGALARVAEAAGVAGLFLAIGTAHPNHPRALRASAGSLLRLPTARLAEVEATRRHLGPEVPWFSLQPRGGDSLYRASLPRPAVLALGAEGPGLSPAVAAVARRSLTIPLAAPVESLNATVAAALALFEWRHRSAGKALDQPSDSR
ncbi:MAG: RNA methyltransferase [Acidobacteriota bacterium]